jgi:hypothetical protein
MPLAMAFWMVVWKVFMSNGAAIVGLGIGEIGRVGRFCIGIPRFGIGLYAKNARGSLERSCVEGPGVGASSLLFSPSSESPAMEDNRLLAVSLSRCCSHRRRVLCHRRSLEGICWYGCEDTVEM